MRSWQIFTVQKYIYRISECEYKSNPSLAASPFARVPISISCESFESKSWFRVTLQKVIPGFITGLNVERGTEWKVFPTHRLVLMLERGRGHWKWTREMNDNLSCSIACRNVPYRLTFCTQPTCPFISFFFFFLSSVIWVIVAVHAVKPPPFDLRAHSCDLMASETVSPNRFH